MGGFSDKTIEQREIPHTKKVIIFALWRISTLSDKSRTNSLNTSFFQSLAFRSRPSQLIIQRDRGNISLSAILINWQGYFGYKWVGENVHLLSPSAWRSYIYTHTRMHFFLTLVSFILQSHVDDTHAHTQRSKVWEANNL